MTPGGTKTLLHRVRLPAALAEQARIGNIRHQVLGAHLSCDVCLERSTGQVQFLCKNIDGSGHPYGEDFIAGELCFECARPVLRAIEEYQDRAKPRLGPGGCGFLCDRCKKQTFSYPTHTAIGHICNSCRVDLRHRQDDVGFGNPAVGFHREMERLAKDRAFVWESNHMDMMVNGLRHIESVCREDLLARVSQRKAAASAAEALAHGLASLAVPIVSLRCGLAAEYALVDSDPVDSPWDDFRIVLQGNLAWVSALDTMGSSVAVVRTVSGSALARADVWPDVLRLLDNIVRGVCITALTEGDRRESAPLKLVSKKRHPPREAALPTAESGPVKIRHSILGHVKILFEGMGQSGPRRPGQPHFRRGHWAWQPCGPGRSERKRIMRRATYVSPGAGRFKEARYEVV